MSLRISMRVFAGVSSMTWLLAALLSATAAARAEDAAPCRAASESCLLSCKRFDIIDARHMACRNHCATRANDRKVCPVVAPAVAAPPPSKAVEANDVAPEASAQPTEAESSVGREESTEVTPAEPVEQAAEQASESRSEPQAEPTAESPTTLVAESAPSAAAAPAEAAIVNATVAIEPSGAAPLTLASKKEAVREREKNAQMVAAIRDGNLKFIRRLVEMHGLSPTYVYGYDFNPQTRRHDGHAIRLRLTDVYNDTNTLRGDTASLDRILALFMELGMDVKATLAVNVPSANGSGTTLVARTAWGPSLRMMETARDRAARVKAFEMSLQAGLTPNDDFSDWLFAELPQICGRDRSRFAIQVFDLLVKHLGPTLAESLWRDGPRGPETLADLLDRSLPPAQAKNSYQATQFAIQDSVWENCTHLSKRVDRFLTKSN
jgi:hypothetical protein